MMCDNCERAIGLIDGKITVSEVYRHDPTCDADYTFCSVSCLRSWYV